MNDLLSISQLAKLRGLTTETLRHYDRIGLFSPIYIDPETNYRYYSILQYEQLGTIKELRQLGFSLEEIKDFFHNRCVEHSLEILKSRHDDLHKELLELKKKEACLAEKIRFVESLPPRSVALTPSIEDLPERFYLSKKDIVKTDEDMGFSYSELEAMLNEISPILASDRVGAIPVFNKERSELERCWETFIFVGKMKKNNPNYHSFPAGQYASITSYDGWPNQEKAFSILLSFIRENHYLINGTPLIYFLVDLTIAAEKDEFAFTIQIPVRPMS